MKEPGPITLADIEPEWIALRQEIIARDNVALRGEPATAGRFKIEAKGLTSNEWHILCLPGGATAFKSASDRDTVLEKLQGKS